MPAIYVTVYMSFSGRRNYRTRNLRVRLSGVGRDHDSRRCPGRRRLDRHRLARLQRKHAVSDETCQRVRVAAARLDYWPNEAARSLTTNRTHTLGVLLPDLYGEFFSEVIRGIDHAARAGALPDPGLQLPRGHRRPGLRRTVAARARGWLIVMAPGRGNGCRDQPDDRQLPGGAAEPAFRRAHVQHDLDRQLRRRLRDGATPAAGRPPAHRDRQGSAGKRRRRGEAARLPDGPPGRRQGRPPCARVPGRLHRVLRISVRQEDPALHPCGRPPSSPPTTTWPWDS